MRRCWEKFRTLWGRQRTAVELAKFRALVPITSALGEEKISDTELKQYAAVASLADAQAAFGHLYKHIVGELRSMPAFGGYVDESFTVDKDTHFTLNWCERGARTPYARVATFPDLMYEILVVLLPGDTTATVAQALDSSADHRLLGWIGRAAQIKHMLAINRGFGRRLLRRHIQWMGEEWVRIGAAASYSEALHNRDLFAHWLQLGGVHYDDAWQLVQVLDIMS